MLNENFPESLQHLFQCHKCRTFWEADKYTACPACRSQAHILYQCKNCQTLTLNTTESIFVKSMRFECAACGAKTNANAFLLAHKCKENEAIVLSENASCDLCRNKYDDLTQMATSSNDSAQIVSAPILNPPTDSPKSDKPIFPKTGNSMAEFIADVEKQFLEWISEKPRRAYFVRSSYAFCGIFLLLVGGLAKDAVTKMMNFTPEIRGVNYEKKQYFKGDKVILVPDVFDSENDLLTYKWTASNGAEIKTLDSNKVLLDTAGCSILSAESSIEVSLIVEDKYRKSNPYIVNVQVVNRTNTPPNVKMIILLNGADRYLQSRKIPIKIDATDLDRDKLTYLWLCNNDSIQINPDPLIEGKAWIDTTALDTSKLPVKITVSCDVSDSKAASRSPLLDITILPQPRTRKAKSYYRKSLLR